MHPECYQLRRPDSPRRRCLAAPLPYPTYDLQLTTYDLRLTTVNSHLPHQRHIAFIQHRFTVNEFHFGEEDVYAGIQQAPAVGTVPAVNRVVGLEIIEFEHGFTPPVEDQEGLDVSDNASLRLDHEYVIDPVAIR